MLSCNFCYFHPETKFPLNHILYNDSVAMIYFMLDDLGCPAGVFAMLFSEIAIQVIHFNLFVSRAGSHTFQ